MRTELRRSLGLPMLMFYGVGTMVGAGFYALLGAVAEQAGRAAPGAFLLAGLLALPTALSFSELAGGHPVSAGGLRFAAPVNGRRTPGRDHGHGVHGHAPPRGWWLPARGDQGPLVAAALGAVLLLSALAAWGVAQSALAVCVITVLEVAGLFAAVACAPTTAAELLAGSASCFAPSTGVLGLVGGGLIAFYAFGGFEDLVHLAEEGAIQSAPCRARSWVRSRSARCSTSWWRRSR